MPKVAENQGRPPGGGDGERVLHREEVAGGTFVGFRNSELQEDRGCIAWTVQHPPSAGAQELGRMGGVSQVGLLGVEHGGKDRCGQMVKGAGECP